MVTSQLVSWPPPLPAAEALATAAPMPAMPLALRSHSRDLLTQPVRQPPTRRPGKQAHVVLIGVACSAGEAKGRENRTVRGANTGCSKKHRNRPGAEPQRHQKQPAKPENTHPKATHTYLELMGAARGAGEAKDSGNKTVATQKQVMKWSINNGRAQSPSTTRRSPHHEQTRTQTQPVHAPS